MSIEDVQPQDGGRHRAEAADPRVAARHRARVAAKLWRYLALILVLLGVLFLLRDLVPVLGAVVDRGAAGVEPGVEPRTLWISAGCLLGSFVSRSLSANYYQKASHVQRFPNDA